LVHVWCFHILFFSLFFWCHVLKTENVFPSLAFSKCVDLHSTSHYILNFRLRN
jgi:hypothetical protein